ncbi:OB-fold domain-containing protein [Frankia sp. AgPm24]|uniref:Zn-ribbon domain-containing OB-fold protein n=1 Tax=Frankia sp. AgPm24 TaxID=631128 RepID=UPI00200FE24C|nr:OB-fold domain-containing protein [Frankia sp. AgPm24]MCK9922982.1 OB-fold domain-containing protein [Frankia sp. AgPm24]
MTPAGTAGTAGATGPAGAGTPAAVSPRPVPVPDEQSAPFWAATARHVLTAARCARCRSLTIPPDQVCPHCDSTDPEFVFEPVSGRGRIRSWTVVRQSFLPGFNAELPYLLVDVELDEQKELRMIGRLLDGPDSPVRLGTPVRVAFEDIADGVSIPAFVLANSVGGSDPREDA